MKKKTITGWLAAITFLLATVALQLYFNKDHYFAMMRAKCSFTMIVFIGAIATVIFKVIEQSWNKQERQKMVLLDWCVVTFGCSSLVTCLLSQDPALTLVGTKGMFVGAFTYFTGMILYFIVSRNMIPEKWILCILLFSWSVIFLWTILNQCGIDFFGMHENMQPGTQWGHVSSMGNTNSACDTFSTIISFSTMLLIMTYNNITKYLLAIVCFIGLIASYSLRDEGVLIGLLVMIPFVIVATMSDIRKIKKVILVLLLLGLSLSAYHFLSICSIIKSHSGLIYQIAKYWLGEIVTIISAVILLSKRCGVLKFGTLSLKYTRIALTWICVGVLLGFVMVSIAKSFYDPNYGSTRGAIWKGSIWSFRLYKPIEMIFGQGSGMFAKNVTLAFAMLFGKESVPMTYATCHNSLLQALLGEGIIGFSCLLLGVIAMLRDWVCDLRPIVMRPVSKYDSIHNIEYNEMIRLASFAAVMSYFGASLVESPYPHSVILLFAMLALYRSSYFVPRRTRV